METAAPTFRRWPDRALIGLFALFLLLSPLDLAFHLDPTSIQSENRLLATLPARPESITGLKEFLAGWEAYFSDHFGCRQVLIMWHNKLKWSLFREKSVRNVLVGTGGWMYMSERRMVEYFRGALPFSEAQLQDWQGLLEHRRDWLAQRGIKYLFVFAPDKQSIYPEYLPAWLTQLGGQTRADQFLAHMKAQSTVAVLDLRPTLLAAKTSAPVYQKTDTHWNQLGAFMAGAEVIRTLAADQLPGLTSIRLENFDRTHRLAAGGDLARGIGISQTESNAVFFTPRPELPVLDIFVPADEHQRDNAFAKNPQGVGRAFVYHDSFGRYWVPFLGYSFGEADFFWRYHLDAPLIEQQKPTVVITEMLERFFNMTDPKELSVLEALP